jgi:hypothetical protein
MTHPDPSDLVEKPLGQIVGSYQKRRSTATGVNLQQAEQANRMIKQLVTSSPAMEAWRQQADQVNRMVKERVINSPAMEA